MKNTIKLEEADLEPGGCYGISTDDFNLLKSRVQIKDLPYYRDRKAKYRIVAVYTLFLILGTTIMALSALI